MVRGCYRRAQGGPGTVPPEVEDDPDIAEEVSPAHKKTKQKGKGKAAQKKPNRQVVIAADNSESGEFFDLDAISSATEDDDVPRASAKKRGRPRKAAPSAVRVSMEDFLANIPGPTMPDNDPPRKGPGRPRKYMASPSPAKLTMEDVLARLPSPSMPMHTGTIKRPKTKATTRKKGYLTAATMPVPMIVENSSI